MVEMGPRASCVEKEEKKVLWNIDIPFLSEFIPDWVRLGQCLSACKGKGISPSKFLVELSILMNKVYCKRIMSLLMEA